MLIPDLTPDERRHSRMAFAAVALRQFWTSGIATWPQAALGIATVLALPVMNSIEQADPDQHQRA